MPYDLQPIDVDVETTPYLDAVTGGSGGGDTGTGAKGDGSFALVSFQPQAKIEDVRTFLENHKFAVVDGPHNGMYKISMTGIPKADLAKTLQRLQSESTVVRAAFPTE